VITPDQVKVQEFGTLNQTYEIVYDSSLAEVPETYDYAFYDVVNDPTLLAWNQASWSEVSPMSFTLTVNVDDVFDRTLRYVDIDANRFSTNHFSTLPESYGAIYSYTPPAAGLKPYTFIVRMYPTNTQRHLVTEDQLDSYTITVLVQSNFSIANAKFSEAVAKGSFAASSP
jgi:hypothetical protein